MLSATVSKSFLAALAEITASIEKFKVEQDSLIEIGCYFYRAESIISQLAENSPENAIETLQSLSRNNDLAKGVLGKLGEIILEDDSKTSVAKRTSPVLTEMLLNGDPATRLAVFKALKQISSHAASGRILVKAGIIGTMVQEMFSTKMFSEPIDSFEEPLAILTNILESGVELENLMVNSQGDTKISGYILFNIIYMIKSSTLEDLKISLIRILYHMAKSIKSAAQVLSAVKESEVSYTFLELLNNPRDEIAIAAINFLTLEGLVGIVVKITATLYDPQMLVVAVNYNFTSVLTELLTETSSNEVQRLAATGLEKLSAQSIHLSKPPERKRKKFLNLFYLPKFLFFKSSRKTKAKLCIVHKGVCFKQNTLCLIEAKAVERLLTSLEHQNADVAEAALSAISTLLDDKVDLRRSLAMLSEMNAIQQVLKAVRLHKIESLWQKAFWMIERFLMIGRQESISLVSQDKLFFITVVTAFHHGDAHTRQMAEKILRYLCSVSE